MSKLPTPRTVYRTLMWLNAVVAVAYVASAYAGYVDPHYFAIVSLLGLAYPVMLILLLCFVGVWLAVRSLNCWRNLWICGIALVLTVPQLLAFCPLKGLFRSGKLADFRLMSYNVYEIRHAEGEPSPLDEILENDPDFVCLQEMPTVEALDKSKNDDRWKQIRKKYPYVETAKTTSVGFMSKQPAEMIEERSDMHYFGYAIYKTTIADSKAYIINVHLESIGLNDSDKQLYMKLTSKHPQVRGVRSQLMSKLCVAFRNRALQAKEIRQKADSLQRYNSDATVMICGDFNDTPYSYAYLTARGNFADAYCDGGVGPMITYNRNRFYFHIDQILYSDRQIEAVACRRGTSKASDHYAVIADFKIKKKTTK